MAAFFGSTKHFWTKSFEESSLVISKVFKNGYPTVNLITGIVIAVLALVTMIANGIVIAAIWKDPFKQLRSSPSNIIIASMACSDFLVGLVCAVLQAFWFISLSFSEAKMPTSLSVIVFYVVAFFIAVTMFHILALTIDRVIAVVNPLLYKSRVTKKRLLIAVLLIWGYAVTYLLLQIPLRERILVHIVTGMVIFSVVGLIVPYLCFYIMLSVRRQTKELRENTELSTNMRHIMERDSKTTRSILVILTVFFACYLPFCVCLTIVLACSSCHAHLDVILPFYNITIVLCNVNSCLNPFLYAFRLPKFKKPVALITKRLLFCCCKCSPKVKNSSVIDMATKTSQVQHNVELCRLRGQTLKTSILLRDCDGNV